MSNRLYRLCSVYTMAEDPTFISDMEEFDSFVESLTVEEWHSLDAECDGKMGCVLDVYIC